MTNNQIIEQKKIKLQKLHILEDKINLDMSKVEKKIKFYSEKLESLKNKKKKMAYSVSYNMKLRNKIINEIACIK